MYRMLQKLLGAAFLLNVEFEVKFFRHPVYKLSRWRRRWVVAFCVSPVAHLCGWIVNTSVDRAK